MKGTEFSFDIKKADGLLHDYKYRGTLLLSQGPTPNFYRAPINNDNSHDTKWKTATNGQALKEYKIGTKSDGRKVIRTVFSYTKQPDFQVSMDYTIEGNGAVTVKLTSDATNTKMRNYLRIGTDMRLPEGYENITWYGNGPVESMSDRNNFAVVDKYQSTVSEMFYPYLETQDTGTLTGMVYGYKSEPERGACCRRKKRSRDIGAAFYGAGFDKSQTSLPAPAAKRYDFICQPCFVGGWKQELRAGYVDAIYAAE